MAIIFIPIQKSYYCLFAYWMCLIALRVFLSTEAPEKIEKQICLNKNAKK